MKFFSLVLFAFLLLAPPSKAGITFAWRSPSLTAVTSRAGSASLATGLPASTATINVDATAIGGQSVSLSNVTYLAFKGYENLPLTQAISVLIRVKPTYSGTPAGDRGIITIGHNYYNHFSGSIQINHQNGTSNINVLEYGDSTNIGINAAGATSWSPVSSQWYDLFFSWDGTTAANAFKFYVDGVLTASLTSSQGFSATRPTALLNQLILGIGDNGSLSAHEFGEAVIWDTVVNPATVALTTGTGLTGASRTAFVQTNVGFDGSVSTDPGASNVLTSAGTYTINGNVATPTLALPSASILKHGQTYAGVTGAYVGSDIWTAVSASDLKHGIVATQNGSVTGTYVGSDIWTAVSASDLKHGVVAAQNGSVTGTYRGYDLWTSVLMNNVVFGVSTLQDGVTATGLRNSVTNIITAPALTGSGRRATIRIR